VRGRVGGSPGVGRSRTPGDLVAVTALVALVLSGCGAGGDGLPAQAEQEERVAAQVAPDRPIPRVLRGVIPETGPDVVRPDPARDEAEPLPEPPALRTLAAVEVEGWRGPGDLPFYVTLRTPGDASYLHTRIGRQGFDLAARKQDHVLIQYPCTSCHEGVTLMADRIPDAHRNIQPLHPSTTGATCSTCHVSEAVERLHVPGEGTTTMDHAYRLCAECHSPQVRDWAAGVHGKRLEGWTGRRVLMNCADCHDPHSPGLAPRVPYPGPRLPAGGGER
jgi:hypothetical protein